MYVFLGIGFLRTIPNLDYHDILEFSVSHIAQPKNVDLDEDDWDVVDDLYEGE